MQKWKKNKKKITLVLTVCLVLILIGIVVVISKSDFEVSDKDMSIDVSLEQDDVSGMVSSEEVSDEDIAAVDGDVIAEQDSVIDNNANTDSSNKNNSNKKDPSGQNVQDVEDEISYEYWLAAAMVTGLSLRYDEFEVENIYLTGETATSEKYQSGGVYVVCSVNGNRVILHSEALEEERSDSGTTDLYTHNLGFATFDQVSEVVDKDKCTSVGVEDIDTLIALSLLVSLYER